MISGILLLCLPMIGWGHIIHPPAQGPQQPQQRISTKNCHFTPALLEAFERGRLRCQLTFDIGVPSHLIDFKKHSPPGTSCWFECLGQAELATVECGVNGKWSRNDSSLTQDTLTCIQAINGVGEVKTMLQRLLGRPETVLNTRQDSPPPAVSSRIAAPPKVRNTHKVVIAKKNVIAAPAKTTNVKHVIGVKRREHSIGNGHLFLGRVMDMGHLSDNPDRHFRLLAFQRELTWAEAWKQCELFGGKPAHIDSFRTYAMFKIVLEEMAEEFANITSSISCRMHQDKLCWLGAKAFGRRLPSWKWIESADATDGKQIIQNFKNLRKYVSRADADQPTVGIRLEKTQRLYMKFFDSTLTDANCFALCETLES